MIQIDVAKAGAQLFNLSKLFNARVHDGFTPMKVQWVNSTNGNQPLDVKSMKAFLKGQVGQGTIKNDHVELEANSSMVSWEDDGTGSQPNGVTLIKLPPQVFTRDGIFYGYIGLTDTDETVITSVSIWFNVAKNVMTAGANVPYYLDEIQAALSAVQNSNNTLQAARKEIQNQIDLSKAAFQPEAFENEAALTTKYPSGTSGLMVTVDTGHKWLWIDGAWKDCGVYQSAGIEASIKSSIAHHQQKLIDHDSRLNQLDERVHDQQTKIDTDTEEIKRNRTDIQSLQSVGSLKTIELTDANGKYIVDNNGTRLSGQRWLINTDKALAQADLPADAGAVGDALKNQEAAINENADNLSDIRNKVHSNESAIQDIRNVGSLKAIELTDNDGNHIADSDGNRLSGQRWLINTDKTLSQPDLPADAKAVGDALVPKAEKYGLPVLYLYGAEIPSLKTKADSLSDGIYYDFPFYKIGGKLKKIKVQGSSSASLAKKNYTLQLDHEVEIFPKYGKQKKYVIKADMTDPSHVRNTGCAELWGKVRQTRVKANDAIKLNDTDYLVDNSGNHIVGETDPQLSIGGTFGAVDGFPIAVYINDRYWGLYNFNVPKDSWMAKMPAHDENAAIVSAFWTSFGAEDVKLDGDDMEIEFCGSKDTTWVSQSINALIDCLKASYTTKDDFTQAVAMRLDIDSAIDYYIFSAAVGNTDGVLRNFLLQTWDRRKWYFAAYDLDMTFGRTPDSPDWLSPVYDGKNNRRGGTTILNLADGNRLFHQLWKFYKDDIIARYKELAKGPLSTGEALTLLTNYSAPIPNTLLAQEDRTWPQTSLSGTSNLNQIRWWYTEHINLLNNQVNQVANV